MQPSALSVRGKPMYGDAHAQRGEKRFLAVSHGGIAAHMRPDLRLAAALRTENGVCSPPLTCR